MLEKIQKYTSIDIKELGTVSLRLTTIVKDDGVVISESHHRHVRNPNDDLTDLPQNIQDTINAYWTQEVRDAYSSIIEEANAELS